MAENSRKGFSIRKLIYNDKYLIIFSIICAIVIWVATSMNLSPETTKTITVPITVDFSNSAADQLGLKCYGEESFDVEVTVKCKKYLAKDISADNISASLQTNYVTSSGIMQVPVRVQAKDSSDFEIQSYYPTTYSAYFDIESQKVMNVDLIYPDKSIVADGYVLGQPILSEGSVTVLGPSTYVSRVNSIKCDVHLSGDKLKKTQNLSVTPVPIDKNGNRVEYVTLLDSNNKTVSLLDLTLPVLKQTVLPVSVEFTNKPKSFNEANLYITYSVDSVKAGVMDDVNISECVIGQIDFASLNTGNNEFTFNVRNLDGLVILDKDVSEITVNVNVSTALKTAYVSVSADNVKVSNIPNGYKYEVVALSHNSATAVGEASELKNINSKSVVLTVNAKQSGDKVNEGTEVYDITPVIEGNSSCWIYGDYTATVRIYK